MNTTDALEDLPGLREAGPVFSQNAFTPNGRIVEWVQREISIANPHVQAWRAEAERMYKFRDGHQLEEKDKKALEKAGRPNNVFNTAQKFIRFVTGVEAHTPEALIYEAINEFDEQQQMLGEVMTRYYDWVIAKSHGDHERSRAFDDLIVAGMGWTDHYVSRDVDPKGLIRMMRLPGNEMWWSKSSAQNLTDTRWRARRCLIDVNEAIAMWPESEALLLLENTRNRGVNRPEADKPVVFTVPYLETVPLSSYEAGKNEQDKVWITEFQWFDNKKGIYFFDPLEKEDVWYDEEKFKAYERNLKAITRSDPNYAIRDYTRQSQRVYQKIFILSDKWQLTDALELPGKRFTFNCMTGYWDDEDGLFYGYMRILVDPLRFANKFFNQVIEIMGTQAKGGLIAEEGAIPPNKVHDFENNYSKPGTVSIVAPNAVSGKKIQQKSTADLPAASIAIIDYCVKGMENVTGIDPETAFGQGSTNTPGITLRQKQKSGLLLLNQEFSSLSRFRIDEGYIIFDLLKTLADDRLIRVGKPYEGQVLRLMREPFASEYDLMLDEMERDPNIRHLYAENVVQIMPTLLRMNKFLPELIDFLILPVKFRQALKKAIMAAREAEQEAARKGENLHGRGANKSPEERQAVVGKLKAETMAALSKAARLQGQIGHDQKKAELAELETMLNVLAESSKAQLERSRQGTELVSRRAELALENQRLRLDARNKQMEIAVKREQARRPKAQGD